MRKEIEALLARENERFERVSAEQRHMKAQLEGVQIKNHELLLKKRITKTELDSLTKCWKMRCRMKKIKRADYIRSLSDEDLMLYIYHNSRYFSKGMKRLTEWLQEEIEVPE